MATINLNLDVALSDVLAEISDDQLQKEMADRCLEAARRVEEAREDDFKPLVEEALEYLRQGRAADAQLVLERTLYPKWSSPEAVASAVRSRLYQMRLQ